MNHPSPFSFRYSPIESVRHAVTGRRMSWQMGFEFLVVGIVCCHAACAQGTVDPAPSVSGPSGGVPVVTADGVRATVNQTQDKRLKNAVEPLLKRHRGEIGLAILNLESGEHYEFNGDVPMPTASLIKLPILATVYRKVDQGELELNRPILLEESDKVEGSGVLTEHFSSGVSLPLRDFVRLMIRYSDNTATNIVADEIGLKTTARTMESLGLRHTKLHSKVYRGSTTVYPKRSRQFGIGSTTASEMVELLTRLHQGKLASKQSTVAMRQHLLSCDDGSMLGALLPKNVEFAHKTGAVANCRTDAGIMSTSAGAIAVCFLSNKNEDQSWTEENEAAVLAGRVGEAIIKRFGSPEPDGRLRKGAFGKLVEALQRTLNDRLDPPPNLSIDGDFGPATRLAVERFQRSHGLSESGIVDEKTWAALGTLIEQDDPVSPPDVINSQTLEVEPQSAFGDPPIVTCRAWAIIDPATGELLFSRNADTPLEAASTTKIMTAFLVIRFAEENPNVLNERLRFSRRADQTVGSTSAIQTGESVTVRESLFGLLLPSGNDASVALAEHFGSQMAGNLNNEDALVSYQDFIATMNATAEKLGMKQTHYVNPHGLSNASHVITANDLARLSVAAMKLPLFRTTVATRQFGCVAEGEQGYKRNVVWKNTNALLGIEGFKGIKTGTTSAAGACLVSAGEREGDELIAVVLGSSSTASRYADTRNLMRWAWQRRAE